MSEVVYNILNFERPISDKNLKDVIKEFDTKELDKSRVQLSEEQLGILISVLFTYGLHYDEIGNNKRTQFLSTIIEDKLPLFRISQAFSLHLLNNLNLSAKTELQLLLKGEYNLNDILLNERLLDFVEMELLDQTTSFRKWEFGRFTMAYLATQMFNDGQWKKVEKNDKGKATDDEDYLGGLGEQLRRKVEKLSSYEKLFLQLFVKGKLWPQKTTMADYLLIGSIAQQKMMHLSARIKDLTKTLEEVLDTKKSRQKGKGGPTL